MRSNALHASALALASILTWAARARARVGRLTWPTLIWLCLLLMPGCTLIGLAYDQAGWFVEREASDYVAMDSQQRASLRAAFEHAHERHRHEALADYVLALRALHGYLATPGWSRHDATCFAGIALRFSGDLAERLVPVATALLVDLRSWQVAALADRLAERDAQFVERYLQGSWPQRAEQRAQRAAERLTDWLGPLREDQRQQLQRLSRELPDTAPGWAAYRAQMQQRLLQLLRGGAPAAQIEGYLRSWWVLRQGMGAEYRARLTKLVAGIIAAAVTLERSLDSEQRRFLRARLKKLADALEGIGGQGPGGRLLASVDGELACPGLPGWLSIQASGVARDP